MACSGKYSARLVLIDEVLQPLEVKDIDDCAAQCFPKRFSARQLRAKSECLHDAKVCQVWSEHSPTISEPVLKIKTCSERGREVEIFFHKLICVWIQGNTDVCNGLETPNWQSSNDLRVMAGPSHPYPVEYSGRLCFIPFIRR